MDITTATPVEIDTEIAKIWGEKAVLDARVPGLVYEIHRAAKDEKVIENNGPWHRKERWAMDLDEALTVARAIAEGTEDRVWEVSKAQKALADWDEALAAATALRKREEPLHAEFRRRGGWTRAFLATSSNGHIHSSRECSTCYETTQFFWFTDLSGHDEAEIVAKAGSDACTVCYPSAPVNDLKRPRSIFSDDEQAAQRAREERAAAKAARDAATVTFQWTEYGRTKDKTFKTLRAATNALAGALHSLCWYGEEHPDGAAWKANVEAGREALGDSWDYDKALAAARKKAVKDAGRYLHVETKWENGTSEEIWHDEPLYPKY